MLRLVKPLINLIKLKLKRKNNKKLMNYHNLNFNLITCNIYVYLYIKKKKKKHRIIHISSVSFHYLHTSHFIITWRWTNYNSQSVNSFKWSPSENNESNFFLIFPLLTYIFFIEWKIKTLYSNHIATTTCLRVLVGSTYIISCKIRAILLFNMHLRSMAPPTSIFIDTI